MILLLTSLLTVLFVATDADEDAAMRSFHFDARVKYIPLLRSLPNHTAIYHQWPPKQLRKTLPDYISAAVVIAQTANESSEDDAGSSNSDLSLVGPPIHVQLGDTLSVMLKNSLPTSGLSIHWHGFEMTNALEFDGVVGVTQCPISPHTQFRYEFEVDENPGSYWYHTHSGTLGVHAINAIHGPLVVHPKGKEKKELVDKLNGSFNGTGEEVKSQWYYEDERILFFKDGFIHPDALHLTNQMGGLNEAVSKDDSGYTVSSSAWEFGTCNGRMREVVPVSPGKTYKFRLMNGGAHYGLRINIADLNMTILAADSESVEPVVVNEVFLHTAERFDVEITIPNDWVEGDSFWIRADSIESSSQGYQNGIRSILKVVDHDSSDSENAFDLNDPIDSIKSPLERTNDHLTMNCFDRATFDGAPNGGRCLPISTLSRSQASLNRKNESNNTKEETAVAVPVHFIDSHFQPYPQHSHFISFDGGSFVQHVNPRKAMLDSSFGPQDMHPNTNVLHVPAYSTVLLVWRSTTLMDHPMHLHGLKMSIIDIALPNKRQDCTLSKCKLNSVYESHEDVRALAESKGDISVLKDTFILPAGGAVVTQIHTQEPSLWYSHCHLEMHHFDGMSFILNVGNYSGGGGSGRVLPSDYPSCDSPFLQAHIQYPSCDCYENPNRILSTYLTADYKCSRDHLCQHVSSRAANLEKYHFAGGDEIHSAYKMSGYAISLISLASVCVVLALMRYRKTWFNNQLCARPDHIGPDHIEESEERDKCCSNGPIPNFVPESQPDTHSDSSSLGLNIVATVHSIGTTAHSIGTSAHPSSEGVYTAIQVKRKKYVDAASHFMKQLNEIVRAQFKIYMPFCVNFLRVIEVCTLGILTGFLYYDVGNNSSYTGLSQRVGLYFFSTTLWTFTRMYPAVGFSHNWFSLSLVELKRRPSSLGPIVLGRLIVVLGLESLWPMVYVLVCYPFAGVFGSIKIVILVGLFLLLNNLCYISLGSVLGVYSKRIPQGMIASTIFSQTSLVAAGFYTTLPPALDWIRYISPFYWTFRGILKSCLKWNDTLECIKGSSEVGANQCFLEYHPAIDQYKERGLHVATYNDSSSDSISLEFVALILLLFILNFLIYAKAWVTCKRFERQPDPEDVQERRHALPVLNTNQ